MEERNLEMIEVSREGGRRWCRQESGLQILWKKERENLSRLSLSEFNLATNKTLGYDMPRVSLKVICTARFWWALSQNQTMFHLRWVSADGGHFEHTCELGSRA